MSHGPTADKGDSVSCSSGALWADSCGARAQSPLSSRTPRRPGQGARAGAILPRAAQVGLPGASRLSQDCKLLLAPTLLGESVAFTEETESLIGSSVRCSQW